MGEDFAVIHNRLAPTHAPIYAAQATTANSDQLVSAERHKPDIPAVLTFLNFFSYQS